MSDDEPNYEDDYEGDPCVEPTPVGEGEPYWVRSFVVAPLSGQSWYPGAWVIDMGGNGRVITVRPAENIFHIAASSWNIPVGDPHNPNIGIPGWNRGAKACTGYNDQYGNLQQYCSVFEQVNGTSAGNYRNRTWEAWNPEGLHGTAEEYNSSEYTPEQCERWSDILAWDANENGARLENMLTSRSSAHGVGGHRYGIDPWRVSDGESWTARAGKTCPGTARMNQLNGIIARAIVIRDAVREGRCTYLPKGRVDLAAALARTGNAPIKEWDEMASKEELATVINDTVANVLRAPEFKLRAADRQNITDPNVLNAIGVTVLTTDTGTDGPDGKPQGIVNLVAVAVAEAQAAAADARRASDKLDKVLTKLDALVDPPKA